MVIYRGFSPSVLFDYLFARSAEFFLGVSVISSLLEYYRMTTQNHVSKIFRKMKVLEILELEQENTQIILHKEGLFIRVYERSAYLFVKHIKAYNLTKKFYKNVKQEVVYLGFPQSSFSKIEAICKEKNLTVKEENNHISTTLNVEITGLTGFIENEFVNWKNNIALWQSSETLPKLLSEDNEIIEKLRNFSVISKTPIDCQQFIVELQTEING